MNRIILAGLCLSLLGCSSAPAEYLVLISAPIGVAYKRTSYPASKTASFINTVGGSSFTETDTGLRVKIERTTGTGEIKLQIARASSVCFDQTTTGASLEGSC